MGDLKSPPTNNTINFSEKDDIQSVLKSLSENVGKEVSIQPVYGCQYSQEEVFICIEMVKILNFHLCNVFERNGNELLESIFKQGYDYRLGLVTLFFWLAVNSAGPTGKGLLFTEHSRKVVNEVFNLITLDGLHRQVVVDILLNTGKHRYMQATSASISFLDMEVILKSLRPFNSTRFATRPQLWCIET